MATIETDDGKKVEVKENESLVEAGKQLGVLFSCEAGICGTCRVEILEGADNLNELTDEEQALGDRDKNNRLCCQMRIKQGNIKIKF